MTPNDIEILIHHHCSSEAHPRELAPAVRESINMFVEEGVFTKTDGGGYSTTNKGKALLSLLCSIDFPAEVWVDREGKEIDF